MDNEKVYQTVIDIVTAMTNESVGKREMVIKPYSTNEQEYTKQNCKKYSIPFLSDFVDIDTYINGYGCLRIQGYIEIKISDFAGYTLEQLKYVHKLITESNSRIIEENNSTFLEVWNYTEKLVMNKEDEFYLEQYTIFKNSGMMGESHPELTHCYDVDKEAWKIIMGKRMNSVE